MTQFYRMRTGGVPALAILRAGRSQMRFLKLAGYAFMALVLASGWGFLYWLGGGNSARTVRANLMVFFMICDVILVAIFGYASLFEQHAFLVPAPFLGL